MEENALPGLCNTCLCKVNGDRAQSKRTQLTASCPVCRLVSSAINFARCYEIQPLRSYALKFTRIVHDHNIKGSTASSDDLLESQLDCVIQCPTEDVTYEELYTRYTTKIPRGAAGGNAEDNKPITTASVHRAIDIHYRIPATALYSRRDSSNESKDQQKHIDSPFSTLLKIPELSWSSTFRNVRRLIHACQHSHSHCQVGVFDSSNYLLNTGFPYAVRLLHCAASPAGPRFRLSVFHDRIPPYITLSHRWSAQQPWKITSQILNNALLDIPKEELPKTIQDAAIIAREIGAEYLWIDSISIVQDDSKDWTQQSSQMGLVFARSLCTFAAIDAFSETRWDMGLMVSRNKMPAKVSISSPFEFRYDKSYVDGSGSINYTCRGKSSVPEVLSDTAWDNGDYEIEVQHTPFEMSVEKSVWNTRGWVFQERLLSKRILYFTREQVFWECAEGIQDEQSMSAKVADSSVKQLSELSLDDSQPDDFQPELRPTNHHLHRMLRISERNLATRLQRHHSRWKELTFFDVWGESMVLKAWWPITQRYTRCDLTFTKDRWFAIQGLCDVLQRRYNSKLHAGIWDIGVGACLLWHACTTASSPFSNFIAPSWSWLGFNGPISYAYEDDSYTGFIQEVASLIRHFFFDDVKALNDGGGDAQTSTPYGFSGRLCLTCPISPATISTIQFKDFHFRETTGQTADRAARKFFLDITHNKSQQELEREYCIVDLPRGTRLLMTSSSSPNLHLDANTLSSPRAIGWVVLDQDVQPKRNVVCAAIVLRVLYGQKQIEQHIIECIVLEEEQQEDPHSREFAAQGMVVYRRIGRGRIVEKGWLDGCESRSVYCI